MHFKFNPSTRRLKIPNRVIGCAQNIRRLNVLEGGSSLMRNLLLLVSVMTASVSGAVEVATQRGDNERTAVNAAEQQLTQQGVRTRFGKLWTLFSDSKIMAQPLYVGNMISGKCPAGCNTVIFGSMKGTVYAYKADVKPATVNDTLLWAKVLGPPRD